MVKGIDIFIHEFSCLLDLSINHSLIVSLFEDFLQIANVVAHTNKYLLFIDFILSEETVYLYNILDHYLRVFMNAAPERMFAKVISDGPKVNLKFEMLHFF